MTVERCEPLKGKIKESRKWKTETVKGFLRKRKVLREDGSYRWFFAEDVRAACMFYMKYRNNPAGFLMDFPEFTKDLEKLEEASNRYGEGIEGFLERYDEWLFRLAFADVFESEGRS